ncbi:hypothetical protein RGCCGE502_08161 [Rhizobium grahamii CCGE 502]|uniref:DUF2188 domain-containing protein n=1 Tax=Rhizobium grahamii CCGE 502 TaxID=990285 RepID=S3HJH8_9HYPH|nr:hypothetical protein RGCCGE502_08161 [Rhizobium grahamii CCGE 502]
MQSVGSRPAKFLRKVLEGTIDVDYLPRREHDGAWAYRLDDVWSETFPTHEQALAAAKQAAERQQLDGQDADITYQRADGSWTTERSNGGDRPEADVVDDAKEKD